MDLTQIILGGLIISSGMLLQSTVGFGLGLFAIPLLLLAGIEMPVALSMLPVSILVQTGWNAYKYREHIAWGQVAVFSAWRLLGLIPGLWILIRLAAAEQSLAKQVIGAVLLLVLAVQWMAKVKPVPRLHYGWTVFAGISSGVMAGGLGMGGPPIVLWLAAHDWPARRTRAFLWATFLIIMFPWAAIMLWRFGEPVLHGMAISTAYIPFVLIAAHFGSRLGDRLNRHRLRAIAFWLLVAIALGAIAGPMLE